jgi:hypothetical protein
MCAELQRRCDSATNDGSMKYVHCVRIYVNEQLLEVKQFENMMTAGACAAEQDAKLNRADAIMRILADDDLRKQ